MGWLQIGCHLGGRQDDTTCTTPPSTPGREICLGMKLKCSGLLRSFWDVHTGLLGLVLSLGLGVTFTDIVKVSSPAPYPVPSIVLDFASTGRRGTMRGGGGRILPLLCSCPLTQQITVGRPRPDLFSRCQLPPTLTSNPVHGLTSWTACTQHDLLQEGFRSFPSGHSSFAWTGMWYLELYLMASESEWAVWSRG